jgi:hypothetical protein
MTAVEDEQCLSPKKIFTCHNKHCANLQCAQTENSKANSDCCHCYLGGKRGKSNCVKNKITKTDRALSVHTIPE